MAKTNNKDVHRGVVLYLDGKEVANNAKAIRAEMKKVREQIDKMTVGSEEYVRATKRYRELDAILQQHKAQLRAVEVQQQSMLSKGIKFFKDYSLQITGAFAALTGVAMKLNQFRRQAAEQEDAAANLKALTGLDDSNIQWLEQQAEKLSTTMEASGLRVRKSVKEILEAYMMVGSKKPELLKDKEALNAVTIEAMRLAEAAKMELKDAVAGVTLAMNQYGASAEEAAKYVNVLAAGSKYGAVGVATQTESIVKAGVAANMAKVPIEQLVGVLETLGERGIEGQIAGTQLKTFFLKLEAGAEDTRPSVVGLQQALETLAAKNLSVTELTKMFGMESISTAQALITSAEKVKQYTEAVTGTNVATEQAAINSDTTAAKMAQVRNQINLTGQALAKDLAPIISKAVNWTNKFVMAMPVMINFLKKYGGELLVLAASYATYAYGARVADAVTRVWHATVLFFTTGIAKMRAAVALTTTAINFNSVAMTRMGLQLRSMNAISKIFVAGQALVRAAMLAVTGQTTKATRAMAIFQTVMKTVNPWALAATAIAAVGTAIYVMHKRTQDALHTNERMAKAQQDAAERYAEQRAHIEHLNKVVHDETLGYQRRNDALDELKRLVPDYHASLSAEKGLIDDNTGAIDNYLDRLKKKIAMEALQEQYVETLRDQIRAQRKMDEEEAKASKHYNARRDAAEGSWPLNPIAAVWRAGQYAGHAFGEQYYDYRKNQAKKELDTAKKDGEEIQKMIDDLTHQLDESLSKVESAGGAGGNGSGGGGKPEKESERQKRIREAVAAINAKYDAMAADAKKKYLEGEIATEQDYAQQIQDIELQRLEAQMKVAGLEESKREEIKNKILDIKIKLMQQLKAFDEVELDDEQAKLNKMLKQNEEAYNRRNAVIARALAAQVINQEQYQQQLLESKRKFENDNRIAEEKAAEARLQISRKGLDAALLALRKQKVSEHMTEKQYNESIRQAKMDFYQRALEDQRLSKQQREQISREMAETEIEIEEEKAEEIKELNKKTFDLMRDVAMDIGDEIGKVLTDEEATFKDFLKSMLKTVIGAVKKMLIAYVVEATGRNIGEGGLSAWAVAKAALEVAAIEAAGATLEGLVNNFYTGGYTGAGRWDEPRGIVHAGEFVANRYAVANDAVRPVLDLIDQAQQNGSIANLTSNDIAAVARPSAPPSQPSATVPVASAAGLPHRDPELTAAIRLLTRTTARAAEAYQEPSPAYCWAEGRGSVNEAQALISKMKSNASRKLS